MPCGCGETKETQLYFSKILEGFPHSPFNDDPSIQPARLDGRGLVRGATRAWGALVTRMGLIPADCKGRKYTLPPARRRPTGSCPLLGI